MTHISKKRKRAKKKKETIKNGCVKTVETKKIKKRLTTIDSPHGQIQGISCAKWQIIEQNKG